MTRLIKKNSKLNTWTEGTVPYFPEGVPATCNQKVDKKGYFLFTNINAYVNKNPNSGVGHLVSAGY